MPSEFVVYGDSAVVGPAVWGDPASQYVVVRDRMLVHLFIDLFDRLWDAASRSRGGARTTRARTRTCSTC